MTSPATHSSTSDLRFSSETTLGITFAQCVSAALNNPEFVTNWQRLRGVRLPASAIERMIDDASGNSDDMARLFLADVLDLLYLRLPKDVRV
jgi:hypothetical protein